MLQIYGVGASAWGKFAEALLLWYATASDLRLPQFDCGAATQGDLIFVFLNAAKIIEQCTAQQLTFKVPSAGRGLLQDLLTFFGSWDDRLPSGTPLYTKAARLLKRYNKLKQDQSDAFLVEPLFSVGSERSSVESDETRGSHSSCETGLFLELQTSEARGQRDRDRRDEAQRGLKTLKRQMQRTAAKVAQPDQNAVHLAWLETEALTLRDTRAELRESNDRRKSADFRAQKTESRAKAAANCESISLPLVVIISGNSRLLDVSAARVEKGHERIEKLQTKTARLAGQLLEKKNQADTSKREVTRLGRVVKAAKISERNAHGALLTEVLGETLGDDQTGTQARLRRRVTGAVTDASALLEELESKRAAEPDECSDGAEVEGSNENNAFFNAKGSTLRGKLVILAGLSARMPSSVLIKDRDILGYFIL